MGDTRLKMDDLLHEIYYDSNNPASYGGVRKLYRNARLRNPNITYKKVKEWLSGELAYTLHKPVRKNFKRNPIVVSAIDEQWQADLVDMQEFSQQNSGYKYILTVIDIFSKYAWAIPLKDKSGKSVLNAFKKIFKHRVPTKIQTDKGKEFVNKYVQNVLKENMIHFFTSKNPDIKCAVIERFNRTLKTKMFKYFTANGTRKYIDVINEFLESYNSSYHRTIKMRPIDVTRDKEEIIFKNTYGYNNLTDYLKNRYKNSYIKTGDVVRTRYKLGPFDKSYYPLWKDNIYEVTDVKKEINKPLHTIKDELNTGLTKALLSRRNTKN